jgi:haloalkane dehalogenase
MVDQEISSDFPFTMNYARVGEDVEMAYIDTDLTHTLPSPPLVFMHGNPAYSYLWRNIIPHVQPHARCIAPDLIGMGSSSKLPSDGYGWENHNRYLDAFFNKILDSEEKVILVLHDFGSLFGLNWARLHPKRIAGLVLMEFLPPMASWEETGAMSPELQKALFGGPEQFRKAIVDDNVFIELFLQDQVIRPLSSTEMDHYRKPFLNVADREALFEMAKIFPVAGNPPEVWDAVEEYNKWLLENEIPKLFFWADPGKILPRELSRWYGENLRNVRCVGVGRAKHYLQEDHPHLIGREIAGWLREAGVLGGEK